MRSFFRIWNKGEPDSVTEREKIQAENPQEAYRKAMDLASRMAKDYLSNPDTGITKVQLQHLFDPNYASVPFDPSKSIVRCSVLEHLLALATK